MADIKAIKGTNGTTYSIVDRFSKWGGYNLLKGTADWSCMSNSSGLTKSGRECSITANNTSNETFSLPCKEGDVYTISIDIKSSIEKSYNGTNQYIWLIDFLNSSNNRVTYRFSPALTVTTEWQRFSDTFEITNSNIVCFNFGFRNYPNNSDNTITARNLKIERGHKATDWSPCWADIFSYTDGSETINVNI